MADLTTHVDDERRLLGIPRTSETPCAVDDCAATDALYRVNPKGEPGIFMCAEHARRIG